MQQDQMRIEARLRQKRRLPDQQLDRLLEQARASAKLLAKRRASLPTPSYPEELPISERRAEILAAIKNNPVVVIAGETGSGKTTQLPKICLEAGRGLRGKIAVTQPRRVAALSISKRIAEELELEYGRHVGCKIRFRDQTSPETYIKVMTDGMLLAETQGDRDLSEYDTIIIDEAHERSPT
jgi:ATP-dependent helicase HrpA